MTSWWWSMWSANVLQQQPLPRLKMIAPRGDWTKPVLLFTNGNNGCNSFSKIKTLLSDCKRQSLVRAAIAGPSFMLMKKILLAGDCDWSERLNKSRKVWEQSSWVHNPASLPVSFRFIINFKQETQKNQHKNLLSSSRETVNRDN